MATTPDDAARTDPEDIDGLPEYPDQLPADMLGLAIVRYHASARYAEHAHRLAKVDRAAGTWSCIAGDWQVEAERGLAIAITALDPEAKTYVPSSNLEQFRPPIGLLSDGVIYLVLKDPNRDPGEKTDGCDVMHLYTIPLSRIFDDEGGRPLVRMAED